MLIYQRVYNPKQGAEQVWFTTILNIFEQDVVLFDSDFFGVAAKKGM